jgi:hypothetical protein
MGKEVLIPKQEAELSFHPRNARTVEHYLRASRIFNLQGLGIEIQPLSETRWVYYCFYTFEETPWPVNKSILAIPEHANPDKVVLPEKAKLVVKADITVEKLLANLSKNIGPNRPLLVSNFDEVYHSFQLMFSKTASKDNFKRQASKILDTLPAETVTYKIVDSATNETAIVELLVQNYLEWTFIRAAALQYKDSRFEYVLKNPTKANVYSKQSKAVEPIRERYIAFSSKITDEGLRYFVSKFFWPESYGLTKIKFINEQCTLNFSVQETVGSSTERQLAARIITESDYTTFLE